MQKFFCLVLIFIICSNFDLIAQIKNEKSNPSKVEVVKTSSNQLKLIKNDKSFKDVLEILDADNVTINYETAQTNNIDANSFITKFDIVDNNNVCDFKTILFIKDKNKTITVFEDSNPNFKNTSSQPSSQNNARINCLDFKPWKVANPLQTTCLDNFWCPRKGKKSTYYKEEKSCNDRYASRWKKDYCGC